MNYERLTELVHFKICELNFELVHVESELSQHCTHISVVIQRCVVVPLAGGGSVCVLAQQRGAYEL